jgi:multidrug efflux pump subunit AcrB
MPLRVAIKVDQDRAALVGLSSESIAEAAQMAFSGQTVTYLRDGDKEVPVDLRLAPSEQRADGLRDLYLPATDGTYIPLGQVAQTVLEGQEARIVRRNAVRTLTVSAFTDGSRLPSTILADARKRIDALSLPAGLTLGYGGEQEEVGRSFSELLLILGLSLAANLLIVVWEFNAFRVAWTIMAAVPFGVTGAIAGLFLAHQPFGFMAFLGVIALGGVVTNHAIVLFEYALEEQRRGLSLSEALVESGRRRLRPILLTVVLSIGGLLPQAVNGGNLWPPMAWSLIAGLLGSLVLTLVIAGLLGSLVLTLVVIPSLYAVLAGKRRSVQTEKAEKRTILSVTEA